MKTMMEFRGNDCAKSAKASVIFLNATQMKESNGSMRSPHFQPQMTPEHPKHPSWSSPMLAKTNMLLDRAKCNAAPNEIDIYIICSAKITPYPATSTNHARTQIRTSSSDCTHLAPDHQTVPVRPRHCSGFDVAFSPARYSGPQDRLSHLPQRRKC